MTEATIDRVLAEGGPIRADLGQILARSAARSISLAKRERSFACAHAGAFSGAMMKRAATSVRSL